jgi:iron complex transport system ATP-binding protein
MTVLALDGVAIERGGRTLLRDVSVRFEPGTFTAIIGANGVGKSSLLATLCGVTPPAAGRVLLDGRDLHAFAPRDRARAIALVETTEAVLGTMTVDATVGSARFPHHRWWEWQATAEDRDAVDAALAATELEALRFRALATLSAGERQRVWLALALAQRAPILALDEPTSHLDLRYAVDALERMAALARGGATVIAVLHAIEEAASFADRVLVLGNGSVIADAPPAQALTPAALRAAYGIEISVSCTADGLSFHRKTKDPAADAAGSRD